MSYEEPIEVHDDTVEAEGEEPATLEDFENVDDDELLPMYPKNAPKTKSRTPQLVNKERRKKALALRLNGASYAEIATAVGYASPETAGTAIRAEIKNLSREPASELRAVQYERLNTMLLVLQPGVMSGDPRYVQTALGVMDRMNSLMGIAGEHEMEQKAGDNYLVVIEGSETDYVEKLKQLAGTGESPSPELGDLSNGIVEAVVVEPAVVVDTDSQSTQNTADLGNKIATSEEEHE